MTDSNVLRSMSSLEMRIINKLLDTQFPGRDALERSLRGAKVRSIDNNGSLEILASQLVGGSVVKQVPVEAEAVDSDGVTAHVLLHVRNNTPVELEVFKEDGSDLLSNDLFEVLDVIVLPPHK